MTSEGAWRLLGGYATGTLTDEERAALFEAAVHDQKLFDALMDEEALRHALGDESYRRELAGLLAEKQPSFLQRLSVMWLWPAPMIWAGSLAGVLVAALLVYRAEQPRPVELAVSQAIVVGTELPPPAVEGRLEPEKKREVAKPVARRAIAPAQSERLEEPGQRLDQPSPQLVPPPVMPAAPPPPPPPARELATREESRKATAASEADVSRENVRVEAAPGMAYRSAQVQSTAAGREAGILAYRVQRRSPEGSYSDVAAGASLGLEDNVRLAVDCAAQGQLYLVDKTGPEPPRLLFSSIVQPGVRYLIPVQGSLPPPRNSGPRNLALLFARRPLDLSALGVTGSFNQAAAEFVQEIVLDYLPNR